MDKQYSWRIGFFQKLETRCRVCLTRCVCIGILRNPYTMLLGRQIFTVRPQHRSKVPRSLTYFHLPTRLPWPFYRPLPLLFLSPVLLLSTQLVLLSTPRPLTCQHVVF
jgi:hypothetical protein